MATTEAPARVAAADPAPLVVAEPATTPPATELAAYQPGTCQVIRRNGKVTGFDASKIAVAVTKAFLAVEGGSAAASSRIHETVQDMTDQVIGALLRRMPSGGTMHIEDIQDQVELALMRAGEHKVARSYVLYREQRARERAAKAADTAEPERLVNVTLPDGSTARPWTSTGCAAWSPRPAAGSTRSPPRRSCDGHLPQPVRGRARAGRLAGAGDERADTDREGAELLLGRRPPAARQPAPRGARLPRSRRPGRHPGRHGEPLRRVFRGLRQARRRARAAGQAARPIRPGPHRGGPQARARPAVHLPRPADPVRPLLHPQQRHPLRAAAGLLHARRHGPGDQRDRPRAARHRVLRAAVHLRLHELHADPVQRRHAASAAVHPAT